MTTYFIVGNPSNALPFVTPHGTITAFNTSTSVFTWVPNVNLVAGIYQDEFRYNKYCDGLLVTTEAEVAITVTGVCNTSFTFVVVKNDCNNGVPSSLVYTVPANIVCGKNTIEEANWEAWQLRLPVAQQQVNLQGTCSTCVIQPCVVVCQPGKIIISGTPGYVFNVYNAVNSLIYSVTSGPTGVATLEMPGFIGEFYVTQEDSDGAESIKQCSPFIMNEECPTSTHSDCGCS